MPPPACAGRRRSRATTLLKAMTTQNVAWPMTIVISPKSIPTVWNVVRSAIPVTTPGSAIGRMNRNEIVSLPEEPEALDGERRERPQDQRDGGRAGRQR